VSLQTSQAATETFKWVNRSAAANYKWVVAVDESGGANNGVKPDADDTEHSFNRKTQLYANIMNGGGGVEFYFGYSFPNSDLTCQDFRSRSNMWDQARLALEFFRNYSIPFWSMSPSPALIQSSSNNWCLATPNRSVILLYLSNGGTTSLNLASVTSGSVRHVSWFDPLLGGALQNGTVGSVTAGSNGIALGNPPNKPSQDWLILIR
jgi:Putative collagen-binding domain of a collagenase